MFYDFRVYSFRLNQAYALNRVESIAKIAGLPAAKSITQGNALGNANGSIKAMLKRQVGEARKEEFDPAFTAYQGLASHLIQMQRSDEDLVIGDYFATVVNPKIGQFKTAAGKVPAEVNELTLTFKAGRSYAKAAKNVPASVVETSLTLGGKPAKDSQLFQADGARLDFTTSKCVNITVKFKKTPGKINWTVVSAGPSGKDATPEKSPACSRPTGGEDAGPGDAPAGHAAPSGGAPSDPAD
jgi:hypothetical protein